MKVSYAVALLAAGTCAAVMLPLLGDTPAASSIVRPSRYVQIVNDLFIRDGWLSLDRRKDGGLGQVVWQPPEGSSERDITTAKTYLERSYLREDITKFNNPLTIPDREIFSVSGQRLSGMKAGSRVFIDPFHRGGQWIGQLRYAGGSAEADIALQSLEPGGEAFEIAPLAEPFPVARGKAIDVQLFNAGASRSKSGSVVRMVYQDARNLQREVAVLWRVDEEILLQLKGDRGPVHVHINGKLLAQQRNAIHHVPARAVLLFEKEDRDVAGNAVRHLWVRRDAADPDLIYDGRQEVWHNSKAPFFEHVVAAFDTAARVRSAQIQEPVTLTLSRPVEEFTAGVLRDSMKPWANKLSAESRAAITIMDGVTGALLALPSWQQTTAGSVDAAGSPVENHNFTRLAPGSVAKVMFAAAVLDANRGLLSLQVESLSKRFFDVAGIPVGRSGVGEAARGTFQLSSAITRSSNRYATTLFTLGSRPSGDDAWNGGSIRKGQGRVGVDGKWSPKRPSHLVFEPGQEGHLIQNLDWAQRMRQFYEIDTQTTDGRHYRRYLWDGLPAALRSSAANASHLDAISPPVENLRLDEIDPATPGDFSGRFLPLTLGGGESRWTNIALAEAFASIVSNQRIRARLVAPNNPQPSRPAPSPLMNEAVRSELLKGMSGVARIGTARKQLRDIRNRLARSACLQKGQLFELFAKTGTPELGWDTRLAPEAIVYNAMLDEGLFVPDLTTGELKYRHERGTSMVVHRSDLPMLAAARLDAKSEVAAHFQRFFIPPITAETCSRPTPEVLWNRVFAGIVADNNDKASEEYRIIDIDDPYSRASCSMSYSAGNEPAGTHLVFVAALYDPPAGQTLGACNVDRLPAITDSMRPVRAIAGALAFEFNTGTDRAIARRAAKKLLEGMVAEHWEIELVRE